ETALFSYSGRLPLQRCELEAFVCTMPLAVHVQCHQCFSTSSPLSTEIAMIQRFSFFHIICSVDERSAIFKNNHSFFPDGKREQKCIRFYFSSSFFETFCQAA